SPDHAGRHPRQPAGPGHAAERLSIPPALSAGHAPLPGRRARAAGRRRRGRALPVVRPGPGPAMIETAPAPDVDAVAATDGPLLRTEGLTRHFQLGGLLSRQTLHAVDDVDLTVRPREIVAIVGESG